ncbi:MAG: sugar phosphate isomerase/epimerase [Planctomycetaceae bacterium]|nr:sugar phosphate isomerase/epimerase [Planctomycetaceae bacterium]
MSLPLSRREVIARSATAAGLALSSSLSAGLYAAEAANITPPQKRPFGYCFNTSCVREQKPDLVSEIEMAAKAGYDGIEPWIRELDQYVQDGGSLRDLRKRLADLGLGVESAIGFANWIVDDDEKRAAALEQAKREMNMLAEIGGKRIAAPPAGAHRGDKLDLMDIARRYHALLEVGRETGILPQLEIWGPATNLSRIGEAVFVATESGHPDACLLLDVYHIFRGGSDFNGLRLINGRAMHVMHINDYPAEPEREQMSDKDRVYPGDGVAPLDKILQTLQATGFTGMLSLELFNPEYFKRPVEEVMQTGIAKIDRAVMSAVG